MISIKDRYKGALLGLAVGDALGTTLEFQRPGNFQPISDMIGGGAFLLLPGQWTDDTSMALCLAQSLIEKEGFSAFDQMEKYQQWYREGYMSSVVATCVDIGMTTRAAIEEFEISGQPISAITDRNAAGNGSIMRLVPIPMFFRNDMALVVEKSAVSSKITHSAPQAVDGSKYFGYLLAKALEGSSKDYLLQDHAESEQLLRNLDREIKEVMAGSFKDKNPPDIVGSGYVVKSLEAALWAFYNSTTFKEGALMAVNLGNDADTTGAVYGQLAGAYYGAQGIPEHWLDRLCMSSFIEETAVELLRFADR